MRFVSSLILILLSFFPLSAQIEEDDEIDALNAKHVIDSLLVEAKNGDIEAQYTIGLLLLSGNFVKKNEEHAFYWFSKAAHKGHPEAQCCFGTMYLLGQGTEKNPEVANYWYRKALEKKYVDAYYSVGYCFEMGYGVKANIDSALYYYEPIDDLMGVKYPDRVRAIAENGINGKACYLMGMRDPMSENAFRWFADGTKLGHADAMYRYAQFFDYGYLKKPNPSEAINFYQLAANAGSTEAMFEVGMCYHLGRLVTKNEEKAQEWFRKAAKAGMDYAKNFIK